MPPSSVGTDKINEEVGGKKRKKMRKRKVYENIACLCQVLQTFNCTTFAIHLDFIR